VLSERERVSHPAGSPTPHPKGKHAGALDILLVCIFEQAKKSNSSMKGEKLISIQEIE